MAKEYQNAKQIESINQTLEKLQKTKELAKYWFAQKNVELAHAKLEQLKIQLDNSKEQLEKLNEEKELLKQRERDLSIAIENDDIGKQIKELEREIKILEQKKQSCQKNLNDYNKKVAIVGFPENPTESCA